MSESMREQVLAYAKKQYDATSDHPFAKFPEYEVVRHADSRKWFGLFGVVDRKKLGIPGEGTVEILNVKCDPVMGVAVRKQKGILPAYHMNHTA